MEDEMSDETNPLDALEALEREATPGLWEWWASDSWLRLTAAGGRDGGVLRPVIDRFDNHVNLAVSSADMRAIATARNILPKVIALAKAAGDNVRDDDLDGTNYLSGETRAALDALLRAISVEVKR